MDDASIIAPDIWSGKNGYIAKRCVHDNGILTFPPRKQFYCTNRRVEVALLSSDMYLTTGIRFLLEGMRDMLLHVYKNHKEFHSALAKNFDVIILSVSDAKDIPEIYRMILKLRLAACDAVIVAIADDEIIHVLANIVSRHYGVKLLRSREKLSVLKKKMTMALKNREIKNKNKYFPATLTPRQNDILLMAADGLSAEDIALRSGVSVSTIYTTKARALNKSGATNKVLESILYSQLRDGI